MPNTQKGEQIVKAITKAALRALFSIGVRSQTYVDKFVVSFSEELEKEWVKLSPPEPETAPKPTKLSTTTDSGDKDISVLIENIMIQKALRKADINTINALLTEMQKRDLKEIKGISEKSDTYIKEAVKRWNQSLS